MKMKLKMKKNMKVEMDMEMEFEMKMKMKMNRTVFGGEVVGIFFLFKVQLTRFFFIIHEGNM